MNKIEKLAPGDTPWGEDVFSLVQHRQGAELAKAVEDVEKRYRLEVREKFIHDPQVYQALVESKDCLQSEGTFDSVRGLLQAMIRPGTEEIFDRILHELLVELEAMYKAEPTAYLIDRRDGRVLMPITDNEIYTPPDYVDEAGITHQSKPILHPNISAPLTMQRYEKGRLDEAITRASVSGNLAAVEHLIMGPESILERSRVLLRSQGITVEPVAEGMLATIEVGRERVDDMLQAPNYNFHRSQMYGSILTKKILDMLGPYMRPVEWGAPRKCKCDLKSAILKKGPKEQWYEVTLSWVVI
jgi:hypothetical protein